MLSLLERNIAVLENRLILLAPPTAEIPASLTNVTENTAEHNRLVREVQKLRADIYVHDGAITPSDLRDGLHQTPEDERSWHLLIRNREGDISSCAWYMDHETPATFDKLRVRTCPLGQDPERRADFESAVQGELERARREGLRFAELGGWAVSKHCRCTSEGLLLALASYSLGRTLGPALGLTTATVRHSSSTILRRLGGSYLRHGADIVAPYFDPHYDCQMELLRFDSRKPSPKYGEMIERVHQRISGVTVVAPAQLPVEYAA
jgi:hypothetical protein